MQVSLKQRTVSPLFISFLKSTYSFELFEKKDDSNSLSIAGNKDYKRRC